MTLCITNIRYVIACQFDNSVMNECFISKVCRRDKRMILEVCRRDKRMISEICPRDKRMISEICRRDKRMICVILLLALLSNLGGACNPEANGQGPGKGDLLSF